MNVLFLTHKRGAVVLFWKSEEAVANTPAVELLRELTLPSQGLSKKTGRYSDLDQWQEVISPELQTFPFLSLWKACDLSNLSDWLAPMNQNSARWTKSTKNDDVTFVTFSGGCLLYTQAQTAENLDDMVQLGLDELSKSEDTLGHDILPLAVDAIKAIWYGAGPGSFTGLRLGASYLNGLNFDNCIPCYAVATTPLAKIVESWSGSDKKITPDASVSKQDSKNHIDGSIDVPIEDPTKFPISWLECLTFWTQALLMQGTRQNVPLSPEYGKEPTPVLRLKFSSSVTPKGNL